MKKLIVGAVAIALGFVANAASYNWKAQNDWYSPDGNDDLSGTVYIFDGSAFAQSALVSALAGGDMTQLNNAMSSAALDYGGFFFSGSGLTDNGAEPAFASMYTVVISDDSKQYWASDIVSVKITDAIKGGSEALFKFGEVTDVAMTNIGAVPEPTSGLLMLLGMAGLALRRKRA